MSDLSSAPGGRGEAAIRGWSEPARPRWLGVECEASGIDPFSFLADVVGAVSAAEPWAYWRMGDRWVACRGALAQIDSRELSGEDACEAVRRKAVELTGTPAASEVEGTPGGAKPDTPPRWYGGLAFRSRWSGLDAETSESPWAEFPAARFFLPAYELEGGVGQARLRAWRRLDESADPRAQLAAAREDIGRLRRRLVQQGRRASRVPEPVPESAGRSLEETVTWPEWRGSVERVLERIRAGDVEKVVLSRAVDVRLSRPPDPIGVVEELSRLEPAAHVFSFQFGCGAVFLGASPELLVSLRGRDFHTMAVAGSAPRGEDPEADERLGASLRESPKDRLEHAICVSELRERLDPLTTRLDVQPAARLHRLAKIQHLRTDLSGEVEEGTHILDLLSVLHPTAAVCGRPRDAAARVLAAEEPLARGWYTGAVGWFDVAGDGDFVPALRCALLAGQVVRLFAGAGIVEASGAQAEWEETGLKLRTIGRALGIGRAT